jgi:hypothetical protein
MNDLVVIESGEQRPLITGGCYAALIIYCTCCTRYVIIQRNRPGARRITIAEEHAAVGPLRWVRRGQQGLWYCPEHRDVQKRPKGGLIQRTIV